MAGVFRSSIVLFAIAVGFWNGTSAPRRSSPLKDLVDGFLEMGGRLLVCSPCIKYRQIDPSDLMEKAEVVAAATLTKEVLEAKAVLNY